VGREIVERQMRVSATTRIARPAEQVFDTLADMRNETQWNSGVSRAELRSAERIGPGSRFEIVNNGTTYDATIATYERPSRLVFEAKGKPDLTITYVLRPTDAGTELVGDLDFHPKGVLTVVFSVLKPVIRRNVKKQYASLKALCER
jgi:uncharacterized protein YndB with AHSA1/START domain